MSYGEEGRQQIEGYREPKSDLNILALRNLKLTSLNECLHDHPEEQIRDIMKMLGTDLPFEKRFWFCLTGLYKKIYYGVFGWGIEEYLSLFDRICSLTEDTIKKNGYQGEHFMILEGDVKQIAVLFSPGEDPKCTPEALAEQINTLGQKIYAEEIFRGDTRYCNVTALSQELHGFSGIREGYLQTRRLNDLAFFHMEPAVLTSDWVNEHCNQADYRVVMDDCARLRQILDQGDPSACRKNLETLFLNTVKGSYSWALLRDALSYCKRMLELRCTVRGLEEIDLEKLCAPESYLRVEECVEALWPVLERLCALVREQGPYQELMLRAIYYIKLHFAEDLSLVDVANYANMNPSYLSRVFQQEMGVSLREYITGVRLEAAKGLLAQKDLRVTNVAERVGIHDVKYFNRLFKKATGMTPGEYRESLSKAEK